LAVVLVFPIVPLIWLLIWAFRASRGRKAAGAVPSTGLGMSISFGHVLLVSFVYLPLAVAVTSSVYDATASEPLTWLAFLASMLALGPGPRWLAWRVLGPLGLGALGRVCLFWAPFGLLATFRSNRAFFASAYGGRPGQESRTASWWLLFAAAVDGEAQGSRRQTDQLLEMLDPATARRLPWRLRGQGIELLAWPAIERAAWEEAGRRLAPGRGRGVRLLRMLTAANLGAPPSRLLLWLAWLLAPERRRTLPLVRTVLAPPLAGASRIPVAPPAPGESVWLRHLWLLAAAGAGRPVSATEVEGLAEGWEAVLGGATHRRLLTRAVELGAPDAQAAAAALTSGIEEELAELAEAVEGAWPEPSCPGGLAAQVRRRRLDRLFAAVQAEVEPFRGHDFSDFPRKLDAPLAEMERWLRFRQSLRRLLASDATALPTAWYNGLRLAACNWPVYLLRTHGLEAFWACREMSSWCESLARTVGDQEIVKLSHGNSRVGRSRLFAWRG
jgi:hypothetical protein